jgi:hypothetical protein
VVSFSVDLEGFSLRLRVAPAPRVPSARRLKIEEGSGTLAVTNVAATLLLLIVHEEENIGIFFNYSTNRSVRI